VKSKRTIAAGILDRLELRFGPHPSLRNRLLPILERILESGPPSAQRNRLLKLVVEAYTHQVRVREALDDLRENLRERLIQTYGESLGIEPPNVG